MTEKPEANLGMLLGGYTEAYRRLDRAIVERNEEAAHWGLFEALTGR